MKRRATPLLHICTHPSLSLSPSYTPNKPRLLCPSFPFFRKEAAGCVWKWMLLFFCCFDGSPSDGKLTRHINLGEARETGSRLWGDEWRDVFVCACVGVTCIPAPCDRTLDAAFLDKQPGAACQEPAWHFSTTTAFVGRVSARRSQKHLPIVVETNVKKKNPC